MSLCLVIAMSVSAVACGSSDSANQINDVAEQDNTNDSGQSVEDAIIDR